MAPVPLDYAPPEPNRRGIPIWPAVVATLYLCVLVPVYWRHYGPSNFLWFSDIALFFGVAALWLGGRRFGNFVPGPLLASMAALAALLLDTAWDVDFLLHLVSGREILGLAKYMFDPSYPMYLRLLSLFHIPLPPMLLWLLWRLGYDQRALVAQTAVAWVAFLAVYLIQPAKNINWVYGFGESRQTWVHPLVWLLGMMVAYPLLIHLPTHVSLKWLFRARATRPASGPAKRVF